MPSGVEVGFPSGNRLPDIQQRRAILQGVQEKVLMIRTHGDAVGVGTVWTVVWCLLQVRQWWLPYQLGPTPLLSDFRWYIERGYTETLRILPRRGTRPTPDLQHMTLQMLSLTAAVLTVRAYVNMGSVPQRTA